MTASSSPNAMATAQPGAGTSWAVQEQEIGAAQIGSSVMKPAFLQLTLVTIPTAGVLGMFAAPVQLIAAPGASNAILIHKCSIEVLSTGQTAFASGGVVAPQIDSTANGAGVKYTTTLPAATVNAATNSLTQLGDTGANITLVANKGVFLSNATGAFTTGTGSLVVELWYSVVAL